MKTLIDREDLVFDSAELGCVLHLPGLPGGDSTIHDRSPYGNHGTITGATWKRLPSGLWCLSFDGSDDYVTVGLGASINITGPFTTKAWVYADVMSDEKTIYSHYGPGTNNGYEFRLSGGLMALIIGDGAIWKQAVDTGGVANHC